MGSVSHVQDSRHLLRPAFIIVSDGPKKTMSLERHTLGKTYAWKDCTLEMKIHPIDIFIQ